MKKTKLPALLCVIVLAVHAFTVSALADAGFFSGDSDYGGGSDWSSSSGWDSDYGGGSFIITVDGGEYNLGTPITVIFFLAVVVFVVFRSRRKTPGAGAAGGQATADAKLRPVSEYTGRDPAFTETALQERISNIYVQMQNAWTAKDFKLMRPYFTDTMYAQFDRQLDALRKSGQTNFVDRIAVLGVALRGWFQQEGNDCMVARVRTRIVDYTVDDKTGNVVSGSNSREKFMEYEYTLLRTTGVVTEVQEKDTQTFNCPNCGAPLDVNYSAKCPYCDSIITAKDHGWVISNIKGISQRTA